MAQKVHEKHDTKGPYKGHLGHKGDIKVKMETFFYRVINAPNVPPYGAKEAIGFLQKERGHKGVKGAI
jgi:hypothetical protein